MGKIVMKESPDSDFYVEWSSVVEAPTFYGNRAEMLAHLKESSDEWLREDAPHHPEQRLKRADETGTTSLWVHKELGADYGPEQGSWDDWGEIYMQQGLMDRPNIFTLGRRYQETDAPEVADLLRPFEDDVAG